MLNTLILLVLSTGRAEVGSEAQPDDAADEQAKAIARVEELGGKVEFDEKNSGKTVVRVRLNDAKVQDKDLECLRAFTTLQRLDLHRTAISDEGLKHLKGLTSLKRLYLTGTNVSDKGLDQLGDLTNLEYLLLNRTKVTREGVEQLRQKLPKTEIYH
jgi:hypothetical protein